MSDEPSAETFLRAANVVARFNLDDVSPRPMSMRSRVILGDIVAREIEDAVVQALARVAVYTRHVPNCSAGALTECSCGLSRALRAPAPVAPTPQSAPAETPAPPLERPTATRPCDDCGKPYGLSYGGSEEVVGTRKWWAHLYCDPPSAPASEPPTPSEPASPIYCAYCSRTAVEHPVRSGCVRCERFKPMKPPEAPTGPPATPSEPEKACHRIAEADHWACATHGRVFAVGALTCATPSEPEREPR